MFPGLLKSIVRVPIVGPWLAPAWFDEARMVVQRPVFDRVLRGRSLTGTVLNAGCGEGLYAGFIESFPAVDRIVNMDVHTPCIARGRADARHRDQQGSLEALPFAGGVFDAIVCTEVLEHVRADTVAVRELARVMKPGGTLLISVPTLPAPFDPAHVREGYAPADLARMLSAAGFDVIGSEPCLHGFMRGAYLAWQWQQRAAGRNLFPRWVLRGAARLDRAVRLGAPWDLVIAAERRRF